MNCDFIQKIWSFLEGDIVRFMEEFHSNAKLPKLVTNYFIFLVPNIQNPQDLGN